MDQTLFNQAKDLLNQANSVIVLLPPQAEADSLAAAVSLHLSLKAAGKSSIIGASSLPATLPQLEGVNEVQKTIGNQKLVISFAYKEENFENVSYDIDETSKKFNLIIQPKAGQAPLDPSTVDFSYSGANADLVVTVGISSLEELGKIYSDEKQFLDQAKIINIASSARPSNFAALNLAVAGKSSAEVVGYLLKYAGLALSPQAATNLYHQLLQSTNTFQSPSIDADTFELAAYLLRGGAQRAALAPQFKQPAVAPQAFRPQASVPMQLQKQSNVPTDWQKPKIFKSGGALK